MAQLCRKAGLRPQFWQIAETVSQVMSLIVNEGAVTLAPAYLKGFPAAGVAMVPLADPGALWEFLVI